MSAIKNHRVVIASLFLPVTVLTQEGKPIIDDSPFVDEPTPILSSRVPPPKKDVPIRPKLLGPLPSIVDDLTGKTPVITPQTPLPQNKEAQNPFMSLASAAASIVPASITNAISGSGTSKRRGSAGGDRNRPSIAGGRHLSRKASRSNSLSRTTRDNSPPADKSWSFTTNPHGNGGLYNAVSSMSNKLSDKLWIGVLGQFTDPFSKEFRVKLEKKLLTEQDAQVVWVEDSDFSQCYDVFCHQVLWPCLHYAVPDAPKTKTFYESSSFAQYKAVNRKFADAIVAAYEDGDIIWVNDYHLMLVPQMVREKLPNAIIGFFLHVAFPSSEIFRCLAVREELLRGILAADLVGFQTVNFVRHFRQTVARLLSVETLPKGIQLDNRFVDVAVSPMGIDVKSLTMKRKDPEVGEWVNLLKQRYAGMKLIVGRDKLDEIQGVKQKLQAFEAFLAKHTEFQGKIILIQVALQTSEENEMHGSVSDLVSRINSRFSSLTYQPVVFLHTQDLTFNQYLALLTVADLFVVTSLREGMALRTHEYVECQEGKSAPLVLSEFAGSYSFSGFRSCISVNPWDTRQTAEAIYQGLTMSPEEAASRWKDLHNHVITQTAQAFVSSFLSRCLRVHSEHQHSEASAIPLLNTSLVVPRYRHSSARLILLDYEDTLWPRDPAMSLDQSSHEPPKAALELLNALVKDGRNQVWVMSGMSMKILDKIAKAVPRIGLCAENGCFIKPRGTSQWINMVASFNLTWKAPCMEILNYFIERTPGAFIEEREASVVYRFFPKGASTEKMSGGGDTQWARRQAAEAQNHIWDSLGERYGLRIIPGKTSFLVLPNNVSRSSAVGAILHPGGAAAAASMRPSAFGEEVDAGPPDIDFVLAIGGDQQLLRRLNELDNVETVTTSWKGSHAKWRLGMESVVETLNEFTKS